ncbi:MAG: hypothetical protein ACYDDA_07970 [Acidiferrobacteraceae bacterium]
MDTLDTYGLGLQITSIDEAKETLTGVSLFTNAIAQAGQTVRVTFRGGVWPRILDNLKKGQARPLDLPGARPPEVVIENAYRAGDEDGLPVISGKWLRTACSSMKALDKTTGHDRRSIQVGWMSEPRLCFRNPGPGVQGEPAYITWPISAETQTFAYEIQPEQLGSLTVNLDWLADRVAKAREAKTRILVTTDRYDVEHPIAAELRATEDPDCLQVLQSVLTDPRYRAATVILYRDGVPERSHKLSLTRDQSAVPAQTPLLGWLNVEAPGTGAIRIADKVALASELSFLTAQKGKTLRIIPTKTLFMGTSSAQTLIDGVISKDRKIRVRTNGIRYLFHPEGANPVTEHPFAHALYVAERYRGTDGSDEAAIWSPDLYKFEPGSEDRSNLGRLCGDRTEGDRNTVESGARRAAFPGL